MLLLYLAVAPLAVSSVLVREENTIQRPVYYTSRRLQGAEARYSKIEKMLFALVISARRLRPYFQAHAIIVLTDQPLRQIMQKHELSGRLVRWAIELSEFDIQYKPRPSIKSQSLADFVAECTLPDEVTMEELTKVAEEEPTLFVQPWILHVDGSATTSISGAGIILTSPE